MDLKSRKELVDQESQYEYIRYQLKTNMFIRGPIITNLQLFALFFSAHVLLIMQMCGEGGETYHI